MIVSTQNRPSQEGEFLSEVNMSALIKPIGMLKSYIGGQAEIAVEAGRTVREAVAALGMPPEIVALVLVNDERQSKDYFFAGWRCGQAGRCRRRPSCEWSARVKSDKTSGASMAKVAVVLDEQEQAELKVILFGSDEAEALRFLKKVVWAQVQAVQRKELRGHLEQGQG
jgi:hypothetical protein